MVDDRNIFHVMANGDSWHVKLAGEVVGTYSTKDDATRHGREQAREHQPSQLVVHDKDGRVDNEATYTNDPFPPRG